jgi:hypothetical protein
MPTIALLDETRKLAGFLLLAGDAPLGPAPSRDCLFMVPPLPFASPAKDVLTERKHAEFGVAISLEGTAFSLKGSCQETELLEVYLPQSGMGTWKISSGEGILAAGTCELAKGGK